MEGNEKEWLQKVNAHVLFNKMSGVGGGWREREEGDRLKRLGCVACTVYDIIDDSIIMVVEEEQYLT